MSKTKKQINEVVLDGSRTLPEYEGREGIIYARVSSKRQERDGDGLGGQETRCRQYLASIGVPCVKIFRDSYTGGGDFMKRPAMREALTYADANVHKKYVIVFDDLKRLARDVEFHFKLRTALRARDMIPRCLNFKFDETAEGNFMETIVAAQAELERHQNRRQVIQKQKARLEAGYWAFASRIGYTMTKDPFNGMILVPNEQSKIIKLALEGFANGTLVRKIDVCRFLIEQGFYKGRSEKHMRAVDNMLQDSLYAGFIEYPAWGVARRPGYHKALISVETFELNQKRLKRDGITKRIRLDVASDFPLRGLIVCDSCGGHITAAWYKKHTQPYYVCHNPACEYFRKSMRRKDVEERFKAILCKSNLKPEVDKLLAVVFERVWESEVQELQSKETKIERSKKALNEQAREITALAVKAKSERLREMYEAQLENLADELEQADDNSMGGLDITTPYRTALSKAATMLKKPHIAWESMQVIEQQRLFYFIFEQKLAYNLKTGYRTTDIPSAARLFEQFVLENSPDVDLGRIELPPPRCHRGILPLNYRPNRNILFALVSS